MVAVAPCVSWSPFRDTLKVLEAGIQYANTLSGACVVHHVMNRLSRSAAARRSARGTMTGCACRCACPTAPPCASSSSSCSGPTAASPTRLASSGYSCPFMWTTPPPCAPTKGRPVSWSYTLFREHYMSHEFKITYLEKMPKEDWWDYGLASGALLGLSMTNKHGCKKFLLKIGLEKIPKEDWWDYIRFGDRSFTRTEYDEQA